MNRSEEMEIAALYAGLYPERCPEKGRSHDSRPCCLCGKTMFNDGTRESSDEKTTCS